MNLFHMLHKVSAHGAIYAIFVFISAYGGGGGAGSVGMSIYNGTPTSSVPTTEAVINGSVGDGPITGATLKIVDKYGILIQSETSDTSARYSARIKVASYRYPLTITATGGTDLVTGLAPDFKLVSVLMSSSVKAVNINPFTTLIVKLARRMPGGLQSNNIATAQAIVLQQMNFGLDSGLVADPIVTPVTDNNVAALVKASEALGEMIRRTRDSYLVTNAGATGDTIIAAIVNDLTDAVLDGAGRAGTNKRISALAKLNSAQVLLEELSNNLKVYGVRATQAMDSAILTVRPTTSSNSLTASVPINQEMLTQAQIAVAAAIALAPSIDLTSIAYKLKTIPVGSLPAAVESILPATMSDALIPPISLTYSSTESQLDTVNSVVDPFPNTGTDNNAPILFGRPDTTIAVGNTYMFRPSASDVDGDSILFIIQNRPVWASFDTSTGRLSGTPTNADAGLYSNVTISVSDGSLSKSLPTFAITVIPTGGTPTGNGNFDPNFVPAPADFLYVDLNRTVNGSGLTPNDPTNKLPDQLGNSRQLFFNSDNGVQTIPCQDNAIFANGTNIQISSYGSGRATVSAYQIINSGWIQVGTSNVWSQSYAGATSGAGPVVGNMIDLSSTVESPTGDVLGWQNLEEEGDKVGVFRLNPTALPAGKYAYDWAMKVMYVNVGANPNTRKLGIACSGRFINTLPDASPTNVTIHNLNIIGFARASINIQGGSTNWHIYDNDFYAIGGMYNVTSKWYHGSGIQMTQNTNNIEINNNRIVQTYDSPITPQHFDGSSDGHMHDLYFHHNFIDKWALGAVEMSDFGINNKFSRVTIEDNVAINGGLGFSKIGDTPQGVTDGFQVRGGDTGVFTDLIIRRNKVNAYHSNIVIGGNNFTNAIIIENNTLWGADYGISNRRVTTAYVYGNTNKLCDNTTQINDKAANSQYLDNTLIVGACTVN